MSYIRHKFIFKINNLQATFYSMEKNGALRDGRSICKTLNFRNLKYQHRHVKNTSTTDSFSPSFRLQMQQGRLNPTEPWKVDVQAR